MLLKSVKFILKPFLRALRVKGIDIIKTYYFNFHYFSFYTAIKLPVFIYERTDLYQMQGKIIIDAPIQTGMLKIGPHCLGTQDVLFSRTMWQVAGNLIIKGHTSFGRGCKISIGQQAQLTIGKNFTITGKSDIICQKSITFGDNCLLSWDILIMDTDFHHIYNLDSVAEGEQINIPKAIIIGNHVWIGCRTMILKGVYIGNENVIAAGSTITRSINAENCIIGGNGKCVEIIKKEISWLA